MNRKVIYGIIYIGIAVSFPSLPIEGLKFIGGIVRGVGSVLAGETGKLIKSSISDIFNW